MGSPRDPGDVGGLRPAWDDQGEDRRDDKHADVCPGGERHVAYAAAVGAAERAVPLGQEIVLRANALLAGDAVAESRGLSLALPFLSCDKHCLVHFITMAYLQPTFN